ncbi:NF038122 family metalloprotease [Hellea balneolensis]|uniref:NF038122 family metalloprotease n=1 Tax=Hellea balneolensis TaxID=287478 RepID=UPI00040DB40F|nr:NF038122 family metalloprotease [Hellea balneolensis]
MYKFFNNLSTMAELDMLLVDIDLSLQTVDFEISESFIQNPGGVIEQNISASNNAPSLIPETTFEVVIKEKSFELSTADTDNNVTSCCPCVSCDGQNGDADFVAAMMPYFQDGMYYHSHAAPDPSWLVGSDGYDIQSMTAMAPMSDLTFTLNDTGGVGPGTDAEAGFLAAVALWQSFLSDDVDIRLDVGFSSLNPGVLGSAGSTRVVLTYEVYRDALIADGTSEDDATAIANLAMGTSLEFATQDQNGNYILDNDNSNNNNFLAINSTTALALGINIDANGNAIDDGSSAYASITFNSDFNFDFDPTDGIDPGHIDFVGVAFHEIGHALGFTSGVDIVDNNSTIDLNGFAIFNQLDIFRYSDNSQATFGAGTRDLGYGGDPYFSIDGGVTNLGFFSSGRQNGDGQQASHWRDGLGLGIMDPTSAPAGQANTITELDIRAFDVIGWDRVGQNGDINLTEGNDNFTGTAANETINGLGGNDIINGAAGDDVINGGDGADRLIGGDGADALNGGAGFDSADYRGATTGVRFNVETGGTVGEANGDSFSSIERYYLSDFSDIITGSNANEFFFGEDGNDQINGGGGIDRIYGGAGNDIQRGDAGNDTLFGSSGSDQLNGGAGFDIGSYRDATSAVELSLASGGTVGDAAGDTYFGLEAIYGSDFNDVITGNGSANELRGFDGDDTLIGGGGNDRFFGGSGADSFDGGAGIDIVNYTLSTGAVDVDLILDGLNNEAEGDTYTSIEWVFGSDFGDIITGDGGDNRLEGRGGNDALTGREGNDRILGGEGDDDLSGGDGIDTLFGQPGNDTINGGDDNDFIFGSSGGDTIDGGADFDTVSYLGSSSGVIVNLVSGGTGGDADGDTYISIERVFGTSFDDSISGSDNNDTLLGNGGNDYLAGDQGNDSLFGGAGIDSFGYDTANDGADVISDFFGGETIFILGGDPNFDSFAELQAIASDAGGNVIFNFGAGNTLTIVGRNIADLSASDFDFGGTPPAAVPLNDPNAFAAEPEEIFDMDALI